MLEGLVCLSQCQALLPYISINVLIQMCDSVGHIVNAHSTPRMAATNSAQRQPAPFDAPMFGKGLKCISAASRLEPATSTYPRRKYKPIPFDWKREDIRQRGHLDELS